VCCAGRIKANGTCVAATSPVLGCKNDEVADASGCISCEKRLPDSVSILCSLTLSLSYMWIQSPPEMV
jgi:hypothetical protein